MFFSPGINTGFRFEKGIFFTSMMFPIQGLFMVTNLLIYANIANSFARFTAGFICQAENDGAGTQFAKSHFVLLVKKYCRH